MLAVALPVNPPARPGHTWQTDLARQFTLFVAILLSGGLLIFPRVPLLLLLLGLCLFLPGFRLALRRDTIPVVALVGLIVLVTLVRPGGVQLEALAVRLGNFLAGFALLTLYLSLGAATLARDLYRILGLMALQALTTVGTWLVAPFLFLPLEIDDTVYHSVLLVLNYHHTVEAATSVIRPDGFFFEPGVFQIYLNLHLYLALFVFRDLRRAALALAAVLSTQSTTGLAICLLLIGGYTLLRLRQAPVRRKVLLTFCAAVVVVPIALFTYQNAAQKLFGDLQGSTFARTYDLITGLNVLAEHPWIGIGFDHERYRETSGSLGYNDTPLDLDKAAERTNSNGNIVLLYSAGIPLALPFFVGMFRQTFFRHRALVGALLWLSFMTEALVLTPFFLLLIFSGLRLPSRRPMTAVVSRPLPAA
jgi:hypothetical protein